MSPSYTHEDATKNGPAASNLEEFLALIAHEVNTPLSIAKMATESALLRYDDLDRDEVREYLEVAERNVELAVLLMERMNLARDVESETVDLSFEQVDLAELIRQSVTDLQRLVLKEHPVELDLPDTLWVDADPTAIREIVFNLLANASKYSSPQAPIEIALDDVDEHAVMIVRNHGRGVTPGDTDVIFEKYYQDDSGSSGVGLGLFISRGLARAHGGDITVRPAAESGSEFRLELPIPD